MMADNIIRKMQRRCLDETIGFFDFIEIDGYIWVAAINYNAMFKIDMNTMQPQYVGSFPGEDMYKKYLYRSIVRIGNRLIFAPFMAERIGEYDLENGCFIEHEVLNNSKLGFKFETAFVIGDIVYLMPQRYPFIVTYDVRRNKTAYKNNHNKALMQKGDVEEAVLWGVPTTDSCENVYIPRRAGQDIVKYNVRSGWGDLVDIETEEPLLICSLIDDWLWMLPANNSSLSKWNVVTGEKVVYHDLIAECEEEDVPYIRAIDCGKRICFVREMAKTSVWYDKENDTFGEVPVFYSPCGELVEKPWKGNFYFAKECKREQILTVSKKNHATVIYDIEKQQIFDFKLKMSDDDKKMWSKTILLLDAENENRILKESDIDALQNFIGYVDFD